ncbi:hypothetical protein [Echinicola sp. 20G]|uniref:hypothetical protein n=1 Tax=Echinicola sp. 20G TaxID=2781961 RepID=UPI00191057D8|nr:hypothetical protein [Echinicola sp. 20G]
MSKKNHPKVNKDYFSLLFRNFQSSTKRTVQAFEKDQLCQLANIIEHPPQTILIHELSNYHIVRGALGEPTIELGMSIMVSVTEKWVGLFQFYNNWLFVYFSSEKNIPKVEVVKLGKDIDSIPLLIKSRPKDLFWTTFELLYEDGLWL